MVAPENWKTEKLPQICKFRPGKAHEQYVDAEGAFVLVNSKFISSDGQIRKFSSINRCLAKSGDVLMVMSDLPNGKALAKTYLVSEDNKFAVNQRVCSLSPYKDDSRFLFYALNRHPYFLAFDDGVSQTHLLNRVFLKCELTLPNSVKEQEAIAEALSDTDAAIESLYALIAKKRDVKQATMQQLLTGRTRLPGFTADWKEVRLGDIALVVMGQSPQSIYYNTREVGIPLIQGNADIIDRKSIQRIWTSVSPKVAEPGDVLITVRAPVGYAAIASEQVCLGRGVCAIQPHDADSAFVFHSLIYWEPKWKKMEQGSTFTAANSKEVNDFTIHVPDSTKEQEAIAEALGVIDDELEALTEQVSKMRMVKEGMMQDLLTGKVRLV